MNTQQNLSSKKHRIIILKRLLAAEHLSYQQLSEEYLVSRTSIANDLAYVKKIFAKEDLSLQFDNSGTYFHGNEIQVQQIMKRVILNNLTNLELIEPLINRHLYHSIEATFHEAILEKKIEISNSYFQSLIVSILLIIQRSAITTTEPTSYGKYFLDLEASPLVYELIQKIEEKGIHKFSADEERYLTYLIMGSGLKFFISKENIPYSFRNNVQKLVSAVSQGLQIDLTADERLEDDLVIHLYQLLLRLKTKTTIINPIITEIKHNYPSLYGVVWFSLQEFFRLDKASLTDDEVGFVMIHFQAAKERQTKLNKILFVCPNGVGTSSFVTAKIRRILPNVESIECISTNKLQEIDLNEVDFVISTVELPACPLPTVQISPIVTPRDMKMIMNFYIDLVIESEQQKKGAHLLAHQTKEFLTENIYFGDFKTKTTALKFLIDHQTFHNNEAKQAFTASVFERECLQTTYLDNGFAIPHGNPAFVSETQVSILVLDKPIAWENQKVDILVLLLIQEQDLKEIEPVMNLIMHGIEDKRWFISKMMEAKR